MTKNKIVLDFDGIFAADMMYTESGKFAKSFQWGIRHSIDLLVENGFEVYIISGDSTEFGQNITKKFTANLKIQKPIFCNSKDKYKLLKRQFDLNDVIYAGDDIYDIQIFKQCYSITSKDTHITIAKNASYVSEYSTRDYFFIDLALHIIKKFKYPESSKELGDLITKDSIHEPLTDFLCDKRYKSIFIIQQYSMRNHSDGMYNMLIDGNLNLTLHRIYGPLKENINLRIHITMPSNYNKEQFEALQLLINTELGIDRVIFHETEYGLNAVENRTKLNEYKIPVPFDLLVSDFSNLKYYGVDVFNVVYNFNISKNSFLDRPYVDSFFHEQKTSAKVGRLTYVLNQNQKDHMVETSVSMLDKARTNNSIMVDTKIMNKEFLDIQKNYFRSMIEPELEKQIRGDMLKHIEDSDLVLFMPFRLSDTCYNFEGLLKVLSGYKKVKILITNPNDAVIITNIPNNIKIIDISAQYEVNKKSIYFLMLEISNHQDIFIPIFENPQDVLHQSLLEMNALTKRALFLDKNNFDFKTLSMLPHKTETNKYLDTLYF